MRKLSLGVFIVSIIAMYDFSIADGISANYGNQLSESASSVANQSKTANDVEVGGNGLFAESNVQPSIESTIVAPILVESNSSKYTSNESHVVKNTAFQKFDDQYNLGYSISQFQLSNGGGQQTLQQNQNTSLEVERLFDVGVWVDGVANFTVTTNSLGNQATGTGQGSQQPATQVPNLGGINLKVGYAFSAVQDYLQITPYGLVGRNSNLAMSTIVANNFDNATKDVFNTGGFGARVEYRINPYIELYADQSWAYNADQSEPVAGIEPQNNITLTSVLGAKFNVYDALQLGVSGFYTNYQYVNAVPNPYEFGSLNGGNASNGELYSIYQPQNAIGGMITVGLTY